TDRLPAWRAACDPVHDEDRAGWSILKRRALKGAPACLPRSRPLGSEQGAPGQTMLVAAMLPDRQAALAEKPGPTPAGDFVLVKVLVTPMCTEYKAFSAGRTGDAFGHEAAGEVAAVAQPGRVREGDRVVVMPQYPCGRCPLCLHGEYIHCRSL